MCGMMRVAALLLQCSEDAEALCYAVHITWLTAIFTQCMN